MNRTPSRIGQPRTFPETETPLPIQRPPIAVDYYGNGYPHWTVLEGTPYARPAQTARQASLQRNAAVTRLRWHGGRDGNDEALALAEKLSSCVHGNRCLSGACAMDGRAVQRWFVSASSSALPKLMTPAETAPKLLSLVPDFGRCRIGHLARFDMAAFRNSAAGALLASNITRYCFAVDASLNHDDGDVAHAYWQLQLWGFFREPNAPWRAELKARANASGVVPKPIKVITSRSPVAAAAYGFKSTFNRRVSFIKTNLERDDRGECRNTRGRLLRGSAWTELMMFLDRVGLERRLLVEGIPSFPLFPMGFRAGPQGHGR
jgi:hypothetical protein